MYVVICNGVAYGPIGNAQTALAFANFLRDEVDPATVTELKSPVAELLSWRKVMEPHIRAINAALDQAVQEGDRSS